MCATKQLLLYTRAGCELCDQAASMFGSLDCAAQWQLHKVDIDSDAALNTQYGLRIPVVKREDSGAELYWPFPPSRLRAFLQASAG
ncbi:MAG: glutaredoxin family protein [Pseudomonadales bacterium]|nr:glutaredoxin family protein [Pseudomonadales bacterium]